MSLIDNSKNVYIAIRAACGVTIHCQADVFLPEHRRIIEVLQKDLAACLAIVPRSVRGWIRRRVHLWVNTTYEYYKDSNEAAELMCTHHSAAWLVAMRDRQDKVGGIEIYNAADYLRLRLHWNGCGLLLHEMCHIIHDRVLGLDSLWVQRVYYKAQASGKYENLLRRDWAGKPGGERDLAYCMVDHKEFFAEMSVAFLSEGYPTLDKALTDCVASCSPPLQEPSVLARIGKEPTSDVGHAERSLLKRIWNVVIFPKRSEGHCNKFYPFTKGQLLCYDPELFHDVKDIWEEISMWEDPEGQDYDCCWLSRPNRFLRHGQSKFLEQRRTYHSLESRRAARSAVTYTRVGNTVDF